MAISSCELTLVELAKKANVKPREAWRILSGGITEDKNVANELMLHTGFSAQALMFTETKNIRQGSLDWVAKHIDVAKNTIWRYVHGYCLPSQNIKVKLQNFSGMPASDWCNPKKNWWLSSRGVSRVKSREQ